MRKFLFIAFFILVLIIPIYFIWSDRVGFSIVRVARQWFSTLRTPRPIPDLTRPITITNKLFNQQVIDVMTARIHEYADRLSRDPQRYDDWLQYGIDRKFIDDYFGASEAWEYATKLRPEDPLPFHNLANLYAFELQDANRAIPYFERALHLAGDRLYIYQSAYEFYRLVLKDDAQAKAALQLGIDRNPLLSKSFQALLKSF